MMNRALKLSLIFMFGLVSAQTASPVDYLIPPYQDLSIQFLTEMFGGVGNVLIGPTTIVGELFKIFNYGILAIAMYLLFYTITFNLVNEIGSGQPIAHQYDVWTISRIVVGNSFLLPTYNSGYSLIQVMVMQVAVYGVGLADSIWNSAIENFSVFGMPSSPPVVQNETNLVSDIMGTGMTTASSSNAIKSPASVDILWEMSVCAETQYQHKKILGKNPDRNDYIWRIENNVATVGTTVNGTNCGMVTLNTNNLSNEQISAAQSGFYNTVITLQGFAQSMFEAVLVNDPTVYYDVLTCLPGGSGSNCQQGPELAQMASLYYGALKPFAITSVDNNDPDTSSDLTDLKNKGWAAGSFYISDLVAPTESIEPTTEVIDESLLKSMMYQVDSVISYKTNTESIYSNVSQIYWILSQCASEGGCGEPPYGMYDSSTISSPWAITKKFYIETADEVINDTYMSTAGSTENCTGNRYLDVAAATLYLNWFSQGKGSGAFKKMNLDATSVVFKNSGLADGFDVVYVGFNQRNLYVLLNRVLSDITGMRYFTETSSSFGLNQDSASFSDLHHNNAAKDDLSGSCGAGNVTGCFCAMVTNPSVVTPGKGLLGSFAGNMTASGQFLTVNPIASLRSMGLDIFQHSINTMVQSLRDAFQTTRQLAINYFSVMMTIQIPFTAFGWALSYFYQSGANAFNAFVNLVRVWFTVFQFMQLLDFQQMELYRGILSTFTSITPMIGFTLGIYLPMVPAFYYLFAVVGWMIAVIEAMIAAPIIALGLTYPKGHDLLGNSEQGIILLLQLFARPVSIVFGLMAGLLLSSILFQLFNYMMIGFLAGYAGSFSEFGFDQTGTLIGIALIVLSYAYIAIVIVSNSFTLIYRLPDRILRWIGAPIDPIAVGEMVNEVRRGAGDAMSKGLRSGSQTRNEISSVDSSRIEAGGVTEWMRDRGDKK